MANMLNVVVIDMAHAYIYIFYVIFYLSFKDNDIFKRLYALCQNSFCKSFSRILFILDGRSK